MISAFSIFFFFDFFSLALWFFFLLISINTRRIRSKLSIDPIILYLLLYLISFIIDHIFFDYLPYYGIQIFHTSIALIIIIKFSNIQIIGLTGGIACGKSTVSRIMTQKLHLDIVDCDVLARRIVEPGKPAYKQIVNFYIYVFFNFTRLKNLEKMFCRMMDR